jgi:hypothetical protein
MIASPSREAVPPRVRHGARRGHGPPRGLPDAIVQRLHAETAAAGLEATIVRHRLHEHGIASRPMSSAEFQGFVAEVWKIGGAIRAMGITAQ